MTGPTGNSKFCFPSSLRISGKQNSLFPLEPVIKCLMVKFLFNSYLLKPATHLAILYVDRGEFDRQRFSPPIDVEPATGDLFRRARRCGTSTLFPGSIEGHFEKSCDTIVHSDSLTIWRFAAISVENRGTGHT